MKLLLGIAFILHFNLIFSQQKVVPAPADTLKIRATPFPNNAATHNLPDQLPLATPSNIKTFKSIVADQMEVAGNDYFGVQTVGTAVANNEWWASRISFNEWYPVKEGTKRCACGFMLRFRKMELLDHAYMIYDIDHNMYLRPFSKFQYLVEEPDNLTPPFNREIEGEISLTDDLDDVNNEEMFSPDDGLLSKNISKPLCIYGTWLVDDNRIMKSGTEKEDGEFELTQRHVEIHPAEQIWFKNSRGTLYLTNVADYSRRYNVDDDDNFDKTNGNLVKPWAETPLKGNFAVAFECKPNGNIQDYKIYTTYANNMFERANDGQTHVLKYKGKILVQVTENSGTYNDFISVSFDSVTLRPDGVIQGYILIKSTLGKKDINGGTITLAVTKNEVIQPGFYNLQVKSIKRLDNNSYRCRTPEGATVTWPESTSGYDEATANFELTTTGGKVSRTFSIPTNQSLPTTTLRVIGKKISTQDNLLFTITAKDNEGNNLGKGKIFAESIVGKKSGVQKIKLILTVDCNDPGNAYKRKPGSTQPKPESGLSRLSKFEVTYTIEKVDASFEDHNIGH